MPEPMQPRHVSHAWLELLAEKVTQDGGELRQLTGEDYGPITSVSLG